MTERLRRNLPLALLLAVATAACSGRGFQGPPRHLILITMDTTRQDRLSCYGYPAETSPNLDELADSGVLFANAYTAAPITLPSHATIMTGTYPFYHGARDNGLYRIDETNITLAERLRDSGFATGAVVAAAVLRPRYGINQGFDHYDAEVHTGFRPTGHVAERNAAEVTQRALDWARRAAAGDDRIFLWAHYFDPHAPWSAPREFVERFDEPYDAEIAYMDHEIGRLLDGLDDSGILEHSLVVVVADHGEGLGDHQELTHGMFLYDETIKVPLIMAGSTVPAGLEIDDLVRTVDIVPTVLDLLGLPAGSSARGPLQGRSLRSRLEGGNRLDLTAYFETYMPETTFGWSWLEGIRRDHPALKYIDAPHPEIYDLDADSKEQSNRFGNDAAQARSLARLLAEIRGQRPPGGTPLATPLTPSPDARRELAALGYVGASTARPTHRGPDPKDNYRLVLLKEQGAAKLNAGDTQGALDLFLELLDALPRKGLAHELVATTLAYQAQTLAGQGLVAQSRAKVREALSHYQATVAGMPEYVVGRYNLAMAYGQLGEIEHQVAQLRMCLQLDPDFPPAHYYLGLYQMDRRKWQEAFENLDKHWQSWRPREGVDEEEGPRSLLYSGVCLLHLDREAEGAKRIEKARELAPSLNEANFHLGKLAYKQGDRDRARRLLNNFVARAQATPQTPEYRFVPEARRILTKIREGR